jgi:hypothetical protein
MDTSRLTPHQVHREKRSPAPNERADLHRSTPPDAPRATTLMAGLLARGSSPHAAFPIAQWLFGAWLVAYSCGGSHGIGQTGPHRVPF